MNLDEIREGVSNAQKSLDARVHFAQIEAASLAGDRVVLSGEVLDESTRSALLASLEKSLPALHFETGQVQILRSASPQCLTVATNLTSLHAAPSWLAEQQSQLLFGSCLELIKEQDRWVFVRQEDGYLGWTYRAYLGTETAPQPTHWVLAPIAPLRLTPAPQAPLASRLLCGTGVAPLQEEYGWMRLSLPGGQAGWVESAHLRPIADAPKGEPERRWQIVQDGLTLTGVNYLWGGSTAHGIDCSGFAQLLHRLVGITLPRDADQQFTAGKPVSGDFEPGDLLFFGGNGQDPRGITHVGLSLGGWRILHSSRSRNGVYQDDVQAVPHLRESFAGARTFMD